jgi:CRISPR-associated protein Cmr6
MKIPIPKTSVEAWEIFRKSTTKPKNIGLIFDRFVPQDWVADAAKDAKKTALEQIIQYKDSRSGKDISHPVDEALLTAWIARWTEMAQKVHAKPFTLSTEWRFVTGLGRKGPLETGFAFHRYGFPILPGSSVKGVARAYALTWLNDQIVKNEQLDESDLPTLLDILEEESDKKFEEKFAGAYKNTNLDVGRNLRMIFGTKANAGKAIFFDAIPAATPKLKLDIVNPHYPDYYREGKAPTNWQSPIPSYFLTVAPEQSFWFAVGWRGQFDDNAMKHLDMALRTLKSGLQHLGAGAKTSAGYGFFRTEPK